MKDIPPVYVVLFVLAVAAAAAHGWWRHGKSRDVAESWLRAHQYKVVSLKMGWFSLFRFPQRWFRNDENATLFRVVVADQQLGGSGVLWLRVWTNFMGQQSHETEVSWEQQAMASADPAFMPVESRLELQQRALLKRIAQGETSFSASRRAREGDPPFDELVEHLMAMQVRKLVTISEPLRSRTPGTMYDLVESATLTDVGRAYLAAIG